jgi:uncharacterized membrane protein YGL010W
MQSVQYWLAEYSKNHQHHVNQRFHFFCIPIIVFAILGVLKSIPVGNNWLNAANIVAMIALIYYWILSRELAVGVLLFFVVFYTGVLVLESFAGSNLIWIAIMIFITGWVGQFAGHNIEGSRPSFSKDLQFLLIGPLWEISHLYSKLGIKLKGPNNY